MPGRLKSHHIWALLRFSQLMSAHVSSSYVFSSLLSSSHIFEALLTSSQPFRLISALRSSLSDNLTSSLAQNLLQNKISAPKQKKRYGFAKTFQKECKGKWKAPKTRRNSESSLYHNPAISTRENEAFARDFHKKARYLRCKNEAFVRNFLQRVLCTDVKTKLSTLTMRKRSFCARMPSETGSWRCENEAFVRDFNQKLKVDDVKTKLSCETSAKSWKLTMWKQKLSCETSIKNWKLTMWNEAFVQDFSQNLKVEDVKTKLSCETSFKNWQLQVSKTTPEVAVALPGQAENDPSMTRHTRDRLATVARQTFLCCKVQHFALRHFSKRIRARLPSKSESWLCEKEAFVWGFPSESEIAEDVKRSFRARLLQKLEIEVVKAKLSCETSLKKCKLTMWKRSFRGRIQSKTKSCQLQWHPLQRQSVHCSDARSSDIHCSDIHCSGIHCSDIRSSDIHCSDIHCSDIHYHPLQWHPLQWHPLQRHRFQGHPLQWHPLHYARRSVTRK